MEFYEFLLEEHQTEPNKVRYRKVFLDSLKKRFEMLENIPDDLGHCVICFENMNKNSMTKTKCGHYFHNMCLNFWKSRNSFKSCPLCRCDLLIPSTATFKWDIKESKNPQENCIQNTHIDLIKKDREDGNTEFCFNIIVSGGMGSHGTADYKVIY